MWRGEFGECDDLTPSNPGNPFLIAAELAELYTMSATMPAKAPNQTDAIAERLQTLGRQIRAHRKALRISATTAAEAAGMSRVTLHRIEGGEPSVTMGADLNAMTALGLEFGVDAPAPAVAAEPQVDPITTGRVPARIRLADYPQLERIAWHVHGISELTPAEALGIYERNERHLDLRAMEPAERRLLHALRRALGEGKRRGV